MTPSHTLGARLNILPGKYTNTSWATLTLIVSSSGYGSVQVELDTKYSSALPFMIEWVLGDCLNGNFSSFPPITMLCVIKLWGKHSPSHMGLHICSTMLVYNFTKQTERHFLLWWSAAPAPNFAKEHCHGHHNFGLLEYMDAKKWDIIPEWGVKC